ncbi:TonB-dependent receptor plug domain-containing protein [Nibricoccus sp. IMCC34717]|uniref:TonB-dependent receptor plug domain-containing protein n=1 Tax=Nibricoccus sp. IMCC34717 TaxID=3034021 RepID=UPI00384B6ED3
MICCRASFWGKNVIAILGAATCGAIAQAQTAPEAKTADTHRVELAPVVVSASRTAQDPLYVPSAVTPLVLTDLRAAQIVLLSDALASAPGVAIARSGAVGGQASLFMRGAASHQTLFVIDGIRMNDRSTLYQNLLGGAGVAGYDRIEVLRGPQSTLYGSSAAGGIVLLNTTHGCGALSGRVAATGGSDGTFGGSAETSGGNDKLGYSAHVDRFQTDNERDWNKYWSWGASTRVEYVATKGVLLGFTARSQEGSYQEPGTKTWPSHATVADDNHLGTVYAELKSDEQFASRLTLGQHNRHYRYSEWWGASDLRNRRRILDWQNTFTPSEVFEVVAGTNWETSRYWVNGVRSSDRVTAAYLATTLRPAKQWVLTGGLRYDDYGTFSSATTGRAGVTFLAGPTTKLRATLGTGFIAPGVDDRFGVSAWGQRPNPNLRPEKATGWDLGVDQQLKAIDSTASITFFDTRFRDLFEWEYVDYVTYEGQIVNRARAETQGLEVALASRIAGGLKTRVSYTYLDARDSQTQARLARRPRHSLDAQVAWEAGDQWSVGVGTRLVAGRFDLGKDQPGFATFRAFARARLAKQLSASVRVENGLDRRHEEVLGYAALGRQVFGSLEWTF